MKKYFPLLALLVSASTVSARQVQRSCGSHIEKWREELHLHRQSQAAFAKLKSAEGARQAAKLEPDIGNLAHMGDADGVVARRNPFNLATRTIRFVPSADFRSYRYELASESYDADAAAAGALLSGIGDDDTREIALPFPFPYFGAQRNSLFVNSDGNLSFGTGDAAITDRSLGRFLAGPPRISGLFMDLDPTAAVDGIRVRNEPNRVVISWVDVPEFQDSGNGPLQTFQIRLLRSGVIEFAYRATRITDAVVGIGPGNLQGEPNLVSFLNGPNPGELASAIAERFSGSESIDIFTAAQKFYRNHDDSYDYLVIFNTLNIAAEASAVAYEVTVRNQRSGYGDVRTDVGSQAGSARRLQAILNMGPLSQYPRDPNGRVPARFSVGDTPLSTIAHETGHLFLAYASVEDSDGNTPMLGFQSAHWDFKFNSDASLMEGNRIRDNGVGTSPRFLTTATVEGFSALDQYLMGLRPPEEVPDSFYVANSTSPAASGLPRIGVGFDGDRRDVSVRDLIAAVGRRTPDHTVSQRAFRFAFLVITADGQAPTTDQLSQLDDYRAQFETYFRNATGQRATADTALRKAIEVSAFPAVGVMQGASAAVSVRLQQASASSLPILVKTRASLVQTPASIVIPVGSSTATFNVTGVAQGVDELILEAADSTFAPVTTKVQVFPASRLKLSTISETNPIRLKVTDTNELPYPGVTVQARIVGAGTLNQTSAISDGSGAVEFQWTRPAQTEGQLVVSIPNGESVTLESSQQPMFTAANVVNSASYVAGLTPGGSATILGTRMGGPSAQVFVNGQPATLLYGSDRQLNFVASLDLSPGSADVTVRTSSTSSAAVRVPVLAVQPGIFPSGQSGIGSVFVAGTGKLTSEQAARAGTYLEIYTTGLGAVSIGELGLQWTIVKPQVIIGGITAEVTYSGLAPGRPGLYQINARLPSGLPPGLQALAIEALGVRSNEVLIRVE